MNINNLAHALSSRHISCILCMYIRTASINALSALILQGQQQSQHGLFQIQSQINEISGKVEIVLAQAARLGHGGAEGGAFTKVSYVYVRMFVGMYATDDGQI